MRQRNQKSICWTIFHVSSHYITRSQVELMRAVWQKNYCCAIKTNYLIVWVLTGTGYKTYQESVIKHIDHTALISLMSIENKRERLQKIFWRTWANPVCLSVLHSGAGFWLWKQFISKIIKNHTATVYKTSFYQHNVEEMWPQLTDQWCSVFQPHT